MKKLLVALALASVAMSSLAADLPPVTSSGWSNSNMQGGLSGGASINGLGLAILNGKYEGIANTFTLTGETNVGIGGAINGHTGGMGSGNIFATVNSYGAAMQAPGITISAAGVNSNAGATSSGSVTSVVNAGGSAGAEAMGNMFMFPPMPPAPMPMP